MEITEAQYARIAPHLPVQRGNIRLSNLQVLNAILYVAEHGCKWRGLPPRLGNLVHHLHAHEPLVEERGARPGVRAVQRQRVVRVKREAMSLRVIPKSKNSPAGAGFGPEMGPNEPRHYLDRPYFSARGRLRNRPAMSLDSPIVKVPPDGTGAQKNVPQAIGRSRGGWTTKLHRAGAEARPAVTFSLSPRQRHDAPEGRKLLRGLGRQGAGPALVMDRAPTKGTRHANWRSTSASHSGFGRSRPGTPLGCRTGRQTSGATR